MTVYEMAKKYYPRLWDARRIEALVAAGRLTREEADEIMTAKEETHHDRAGTQG